MNITNDFGSDILSSLVGKLTGGSDSLISTGIAMAANAGGVVPAVSMSKKLAYRGSCLRRFQLEFNLFLVDDIIKDIFMPITNLLSQTIPNEVGKRKDDNEERLSKR